MIARPRYAVIRTVVLCWLCSRIDGWNLSRTPIVSRRTGVGGNEASPAIHNSMAQPTSFTAVLMDVTTDAVTEHSEIQGNGDCTTTVVGMIQKYAVSMLSIACLWCALSLTNAIHAQPPTAWAAETSGTAIKATQTKEWDLMNGFVKLEDPTLLRFQDRTTNEERSVRLAKPQLIGAGGGGAVFAFDQASSPPTATNSNDEATPSSPSVERDMLLKVSWDRSAKTVQRECQTLQLLEDRHVNAAERCLSSFAYPDNRVMILVQPYMRDAVASVPEVVNEAGRAVAVDEISRTLVQMLAANIITIDVQPLISKTTGQTIFIDMTEAQVLSSAKEYSFLDRTLISSFCAEMVALVPEQYWVAAKQAILDELQLMEQRGQRFPGQAMEVLEEQTPFLTD